MVFPRVHFKQGSEIGDGFIQKAVAADLNQGKYLCTSCFESFVSKQSNAILKPTDNFYYSY